MHVLDPLTDPRWEELVRRHPRASAFHTTGWLRALRQVYGYEPVVFTTSRPGRELRDGLVVCAIRSRLTGRRLVAVPFAEHCDPLVEDPGALEALWAELRSRQAREGWGYVEVRPARGPAPPGPAFEPVERYHWHRLDLRCPLEALWRGLHPDCIRRKVRRAGREGLRHEAGRGGPLVDALYHLVRLTRQRHGLPPAPRRWFHALVGALGEDALVRVAWHDGRPAAAILTLRSGRDVLYKYGGSDPALNPLGGMIALLWEAIRAAREEGAEGLDLGRTDRDQDGLAVFKERWGAARTTLTYYRCPGRAHPLRGRFGLARRLFARMPPRLLELAGGLLYRHVG